MVIGTSQSMRMPSRISFLSATFSSPCRRLVVLAIRAGRGRILSTAAYSVRVRF
jgi:hypothetical protein